MSAWAITQTDAFAASVPVACSSNWLSFHNTTNIGRFDELFLDADPYEPDGAYFERSPIVHARKVKTPTLIIHGELDLCTPVGQALELYQALADVGVEVELVLYPREGHGLVEWDHQIDAWGRILEWFDRHLRNPT
jgi:dipeptidyl aminopeptidase/acylaminoacyl peptidase